MGRISTIFRYLIEIVGADPFSLEELGRGGGVLIWKN